MAYGWEYGPYKQAVADYYGYNQSGSYGYGTETNNLANQLYQNAGDIAQGIYNDSLALWEREDSAYQRMVEDMKKAGLNPWAGLGSGGLSTSNINPTANSLTGLIQVLGGMLSTENAFTKSSHNLYGTVLDYFKAFLGLSLRMFG